MLTFACETRTRRENNSDCGNGNIQRDYIQASEKSVNADFGYK